MRSHCIWALSHCFVKFKLTFSFLLYILLLECIPVFPHPLQQTVCNHYLLNIAEHNMLQYIKISENKKLQQIWLLAFWNKIQTQKVKKNFFVCVCEHYFNLCLFSFFCIKKKSVSFHPLVAFHPWVASPESGTCVWVLNLLQFLKVFRTAWKERVI